MNTKTTFSFYVNSNTIREMVLNLCSLSRQVFEISLNSSLITDELSTQGEEFKSYTVYSEKINNISITLNSTCKFMIHHSTSMMEISLESTKQTERLEKLRQALLLVGSGENQEIIQEAADGLADKVRPQVTLLQLTIEQVFEYLESFEQSMKKLWLVCNNLKAHVEKEGITHLSTIVKKIECVLDHVGGNVHRLNACLMALYNQLNELENE